MEDRMAYNAAVAAVPMPDRIRWLPVSDKGYPVPWFVAWIDGAPDFRVVERGKLDEAVRRKVCWVCGHRLGSYLAMTLGPMCAVNRTISEPPSHRDCATFSALVCPFLSNPRMRRREAGLPSDVVEMPGNGIKRNPGAVAVWITRGYKPFAVPGGRLFTFDDPVQVDWYAQGRVATRDEVMASITSGLPLLQAEAATEGPQAVAALKRMTAKAMQYLPAVTPSAME